MWKDDDASRGLGMEILAVRAGEAVLAMTVEPHMVNGQRIAHGGFIFLLADSAFAFACNSRNERPSPRSATSLLSGRASSATGWWPPHGKSRAAGGPGFTTCGSCQATWRSRSFAVIPAPSAAPGCLTAEADGA